jgi:hypothetical protein
VVGDPTGGLEDTVLMAGGAEEAGLAGEGEQVLMAAAGAGEAGEAGGKVARFALGLPNAPFAIGKVIRDLARHDPDAALAAANCQ